MNLNMENLNTAAENENPIANEVKSMNRDSQTRVSKAKFGDIFSVLLVVCLVTASYFIGKLSTEVRMLKENPNLGAYGDPNQQEDKLGEVDKPDLENEHILGDKSAKFALIEYSDFQCPFCQSFHPTAQQAIQEYNGKLMWVFRQFPLDQIHPQARPTAVASECVAKLAGNEAFWKYTDEMFKNTDTLTEKLRKDSAVALGVNAAQYDACIIDKAMDDLVRKGLDSGAKAGIRGTPGNILMNLETGEVQSLPGAVPFETLKTALDGMMNK